MKLKTRIALFVVIAGIVCFVTHLCTVEPPPTSSVVVDRSPNAADVFIGSPSLCRAPDGALLASHDWFGWGTTWEQSAQTAVLRSTDNGRTWQAQASVEPMLWGSLFERDGVVGLLGCNKRFGSPALALSYDGGLTWSRPALVPTDSEHGCGATPVVEWQGRLWKGYTSKGPETHTIELLSAPVESWTWAERWTWSKTYTVMPERVSEPNLLPMGREMRVVCRLNSPYPPTGVTGDPCEKGFLSNRGYALDFGRWSNFTIDWREIGLPGGHSKFSIRRVGNEWWCVSNMGTADCPLRRDWLWLSRSDDGLVWGPVRTLTGLTDNPAQMAWQYPDFLVERGRLLVLSRTATPSAQSFHNADQLTFHTFDVADSIR